MTEDATKRTTVDGAEVEAPFYALATTDPRERFDRLAAIHPDDSDLPEISSFHRVVTGEEFHTTNALARIHGHRGQGWRDFGPSPDGGLSSRMLSERGWIALTTTDEDVRRIRIYDADDKPVAIVRIVPECTITHAVSTLLSVEDIKRQWERNGHWDLRDTEGFEAHERELALHSSETNARREAERVRTREARIDAILAANADPRGLAETLLTLEDRLASLSARVLEMERR